MEGREAHQQPPHLGWQKFSAAVNVQLVRKSNAHGTSNRGNADARMFTLFLHVLNGPGGFVAEKNDCGRSVQVMEVRMRTDGTRLSHRCLRRVNPIFIIRD